MSISTSATIRVGDHDPADLSAKLENLGLALDQADLGFGVLHHLDQVRHDPAATSWFDLRLADERRPVGPKPGRSRGETDDPRLRTARAGRASPRSGSSGMTRGIARAAPGRRQRRQLRRLADSVRRLRLAK